MRNIEKVASVAKHLGPLCEHVVFVGGSIVELLITDPAAPPVRPTKDVDAIVQVASTIEYTSSLSDQLRTLGFVEDASEGAPICRWLIVGIKVDIMPTEQDVLGFKSAWYSVAFAHANIHTIRDASVRVISAPYFLATKFEAFGDRGKRDYFGSADLEDIVAVIDGRSTVVNETVQADAAVRKYVAEQAAEVLSIRAFMDALPGHVLGDAHRLGIVIERLRALALLK